MFLFGHLGIGSRLIQPWTKGLSTRAVLIGTMLPDLIDKPLYYSLTWITHKHSSQLGLICGTRTFGHTGIFLFVVTSIAILRRSKVFAALSLGAASHLLLDSLLSAGFSPHHIEVPVLWPAPGWEFPSAPFNNAYEHLQYGLNPIVLVCEAIGLFLLLRKTPVQAIKSRLSRRSSPARR